MITPSTYGTQTTVSRPALEQTKFTSSYGQAPALEQQPRFPSYVSRPFLDQQKMTPLIQTEGQQYGAQLPVQQSQQIQFPQQDTSSQFQLPQQQTGSYGSQQPKPQIWQQPIQQDTRPVPQPASAY